MVDGKVLSIGDGELLFEHLVASLVEHVFKGVEFLDEVGLLVFGQLLEAHVL